MAAKTSSSSSSRCDACREIVGLWHAAFTSECAHTFHLRCVSGIAACPACHAQWNAPAAAPSPPPATPFSFASIRAGLFGGQTSAAPAVASSSSASTMTGAFGLGERPEAVASPFAYLSGVPATASSFNFSVAPATASPFNLSGAQATSPALSQASVRSLFGAQQVPLETPNPFWLGSSPAAAQPPAPSCCVCSGAMCSGQATVTSECAHTFHLRCFSGSVCPVCGARWRDEVTVTPSPPPLNTPTSPTFTVPSSTPSFAPASTTSSSPPQSLVSRPAEQRRFSNPFFSRKFGSRPSPPKPSLFSSSSPAFTVPSSTPSFAPPSTSSSSPPEPLFSRPAEITLARNTFSSPNPFSPHEFRTPSLFSSSASFTYTPAFGLPSTTPSSATPDPSSSPSLFSSSSSFTFAPLGPSSSPAFGAPSTTSTSATPDPSSSPSLFSSSASFTFAPPYPSSSPAFTHAPSISSPLSPPPPLFSGPPIFTPSNSSSAPPPPPSSISFNDDEPVEPPPVNDADGQDAIGALVLTTHCEIPAVARDAAHDSFAVLVHAKAPAAASSARAALDLVTVLDVSGSMAGTKLALLKQAMGFVIEHLGPRDRLSIIIFSDNARRIIRLTRMSEGGKALARATMESVAAYGLTNIGDGLRVAAGVLASRRHRNPAAGIILLSDGVDNQTRCGIGPDGRKIHADLVPDSLRRGKGSQTTPVHTFGFGTDHDAAAMQAVAEETGGTFSFVENQAAVQDSFAQCIGGLLSVAVQEARLAVECLHPGVRVRAIKSGRYESIVGSDARAASVDVGEMYADEERRFLLFLDVPVAAAGNSAGDGGATRLIKAKCTYKDAATGKPAEVAGEEAVVERPVVVAEGTEPSVEVARERFRVEAAEDIAAARAAAERGEHAEAARILDRRREASAASGLAGDARCAALLADLRELGARVADRREYEQTGRAFALAGITAHAQQRASTVQFTGTAAPPPSSRSFFGAGTSAAAPSTRSMFGAGTAAPAFGQMQQGFAASTTPAFHASTTPAFGATATPAFGAAPSCFSFGFATPAMQGMVESSRKTRDSAPRPNFSSGLLHFSAS